MENRVYMDNPFAVVIRLCFNLPLRSLKMDPLLQINTTHVYKYESYKHFGSSTLPTCRRTLIAEIIP